MSWLGSPGEPVRVDLMGISVRILLFSLVTAGRGIPFYGCLPGPEHLRRRLAKTNWQLGNGLPH